MFSTIDEITISWEDDEGRETTKELDKVVLSKGAWTTILFKYQSWDRGKESYSPVKFTIRRYQKRNDVYREQSKFNISSIKQANKIIETLQTWIAEGQPTDD